MVIAKLINPLPCACVPNAKYCGAPAYDAICYPIMSAPNFDLTDDSAVLYQFQFVMKPVCYQCAEHEPLMKGVTNG